MTTKNLIRFKKSRINSKHFRKLSRKTQKSTWTSTPDNPTKKEPENFSMSTKIFKSNKEEKKLFSSFPQSHVFHKNPKFMNEIETKRNFTHQNGSKFAWKILLWLKFERKFQEKRTKHRFLFVLRFFQFNWNLNANELINFHNCNFFFSIVSLTTFLSIFTEQKTAL